MASRCEVMLAYAIGQREPVAKAVECFGTEKMKLKIIEDYGWKLVGLSVKEIIEKFDLRRPIYADGAKYGHFGNPIYPWEKIV